MLREHSLRDPERQVMEKAYARWAPVYDALCGPFFLSGRRAAALAAREVGGKSWRSASAPACRSTTTMRPPRSPASTCRSR